MKLLNIHKPDKYKVAIYIRLSKEDAREGESQSVSNQRNILEKFCVEQNLEIIKEYIDDGVSGTTFERPGFIKMIQDIELKKINMVISKDLSRLGRDYIQTGYYLEKYFPENEIRYISLLDNIDTGIESCINDITPFKAILNDMYAKDISNKIKSVKRNKQEAGLFIGWKPVFGYKFSRESCNKIIIDENVSDLIKNIFNKAKNGESCRQIARDLTNKNIMTPSQYAKQSGIKIGRVSSEWSDIRIREILLNQTYIGNMVQGRSKKISYKSKKCIKIPESEWKVVENTHEAIIEKKIFLEVAKMIESRKNTRMKTYDYLLKGLIYCKECGKKLNCSPRKLKEGKVFYLRCSTYCKYTDMNKCTSHNIRLDIVEEIIMKNLKEVIYKNLDTNKIKEYIKSEIKSKREKIENLENEKILKIKLDNINNGIDNLYKDKINMIINEEDFSRIYVKYNQERDKIISRLDEIKDKNSIELIREYDVEKIYFKILEINRKMIINFIEKISIDKNKNIYIQYNFSE